MFTHQNALLAYVCLDYYIGPIILNKEQHEDRCTAYILPVCVCYVYHLHLPPDPPLSHIITCCAHKYTVGGRDI